MNKKVLIAGLVASIAMAMVEMIYEGLVGTGFWSAPVFIAATILRDLQGVAIPVSFALVPVVLGMMGHMMNSVVLGIAFAMGLGGQLRSPSRGALIGVVYGLAVFFVMWFVLLPLIDPVMLALSAVAFALAHMVWGGVLGFAVARK